MAHRPGLDPVEMFVLIVLQWPDDGGQGNASFSFTTAATTENDLYAAARRLAHSRGVPEHAGTTYYLSKPNKIG